MVGEKERGERRGTDRHWGSAGLIVALMSVVFVLALGPRLRGIEREQYQLRAELEGVRQEMAALRRDIAQAREEMEVARRAAVPQAETRPEVEVTDAHGTVVPPADAAEIRSRLAALDARQARTAERLNQIVGDLKASGVDLGISDSGR